MKYSGMLRLPGNQRSKTVSKNTAVHSVGKVLQESWGLPSGWSSRGPQAPCPGWVSRKSTSVVSAPGGTSVSELSVIT